MNRKSKTEKQQTDESAAIARQIAKAEFIIAAIGDGISIQNTQYKILYQNQVHKKYFGDHIGDHCFKVYPQKNSPCDTCPLTMTFKDGSIHTTRRNITIGGQQLYFEVTSSPLKNSKGEIIAGIEVVRDITKSRQVEMDLKKSENILSSSFNALDGLLVVIDRNYRVILSNWKGHDFVPKEKRNGHPHCYAIFKSMHTPCDYCPPRDTFADGKSRLYEDRNPVDGSYKEISVSPVFDDTGNVVLVVEHVRDITVRKRVEESLKISETKFKSLAEESPNMIFINYKGRVIYANRKCEEMMGYTKDEYYAERFDFRSLIAPEHRELVLSAFKKHMQGEEVPPYEYVILTKESKRLEVIITTKLIDYENEKAILGIITDITEHKKNEEAMKSSKAELSKRIKELEEFYNMAVGRELRMKQLKEEIADLKEEIAKYKSNT